MNRKKIYTVIGIFIALALSCFIYIRLTAEPEPPIIVKDDEIEELEEGSGILFDEELEDAEVSKVAEEVEKFYGRWVSTSETADYLYGHIDITINKDGTWDGDITQDVFKGTWVKDDYGITLTSELVNCKLFFSETGNLLMEDYRFEDNTDDPVIIVLIRK